MDISQPQKTLLDCMRNHYWSIRIRSSRSRIIFLYVVSSRRAGTNYIILIDIDTLPLPNQTAHCSAPSPCVVCPIDSPPNRTAHCRRILPTGNSLIETIIRRTTYHSSKWVRADCGSWYIYRLSIVHNSALSRHTLYPTESPPNCTAHCGRILPTGHSLIETIIRRTTYHSSKWIPPVAPVHLQAGHNVV